MFVHIHICIYIYVYMYIYIYTHQQLLQRGGEARRKAGLFHFDIVFNGLFNPVVTHCLPWRERIHSNLHRSIIMFTCNLSRALSLRDRALFPRSMTLCLSWRKGIYPNLHSSIIIFTSNSY